MGNESFDGQALAEKLSKLNNSQQSIESLSRWCVSHRKKAKQIVETWEKLFNSSQKEQRVPFLYLSNDILQNSRRKGSEFVNEFWKVLPGALKNVYETGDESGKKAVTRLVDIWEGRKVFGSRGQSLKDEMLAKIPPRSISQVKSPNPIKIVKRDAQSVRIKLAVGGLPEKIISAFEVVLDEHLIEEAVLDKCNTALQCLGKIEEEVEISRTQGKQLESGLRDELQEHEDVLTQCMVKLNTAEANRISLVSLLKEALQEQELKLAHIHSQLQVAWRQTEQAKNIRTGKTSSSSPILTPSTAITTTTNLPDSTSQPSSAHISPLTQQPTISFAPLQTGDEESKRAAAAAVAARLAASTSSAQMLTSILSSLAAEEAASMNNGGVGGSSSSTSMFSPEKRQKLEKPMSSSMSTFADTSNSDLGNVPPGFFAPISSGYTPPLPPPPPISQSSNFGYVSNALPPPPPMPMAPHFAVGIARPNSSQPPPNGGPYYRPPGMGYYAQSHQPTTPPVHRQ